MKRILIVGLMTIAIALVAVTIWPREQKPIAPTATAIATPSPSAVNTASHVHDAMARVPAHYNAAPPLSALRGTLGPEIFTGNVGLAYQVAKEIPQTLAQMPCYCHCDRGHGHKSLYSCFEDEHGANCGICIGSALMAYNLQRQGLKPPQIREQIVKAYGTNTEK